MCWRCNSSDNLIDIDQSPNDWPPKSSRRSFLNRLGSGFGLAALVQTTAHGQVDVGQSSGIIKLISAEALEKSAQQQYQQTLEQARRKRTLVSNDAQQLKQLRTIANRLKPFTTQWNPDSRRWNWEVNLIDEKVLNAWCMPGGKIMFYTGILNQLRLTDDEVAMIMGHEMAHALREHSRERLAKTKATSVGLSLGAQLFGLGHVGDIAANLGTQLLSLKYGRDDETEADLVGLEIAARAGYKPDASVSLWKKMLNATDGGKRQISFLSTHPSGKNRIQELQANLPKVANLYKKALQSGVAKPVK